MSGAHLEGLLSIAAERCVATTPIRITWPVGGGRAVECVSEAPAARNFPFVRSLTMTFVRHVAEPIIMKCPEDMDKKGPS